MKVIVVTKDPEKLSEFFIKQGSFEVTHAIEDLNTNLDKLRNNIIHIDKLIFVIADNIDFASEIRALLSLLDNPSGLLKISEIVFFSKEGVNTSDYRELINVVKENSKIKLAENPRSNQPLVVYHVLKSLIFNDIYKELMGKSYLESLDPKTKTKYRVERGDESFKAFEPSSETITVAPFSTKEVEDYSSIKSILQKTENPATFTDFEQAIPAYDKLSLELFNSNGYGDTKWVLTTGESMSGSTTHTTALAVSAAAADKRVLVLDLSTHGGGVESLKTAAVPFKELEATSLLDNSISLVKDKLCVYENTDFEVLYNLPSFVQSRPNIFNFDLVLINFSSQHLNLMLRSMNLNICSLVVSSLMFPECINRVLDMDYKQLTPLLWLNDNVTSPLRKKKLILDYIKVLSEKKGQSFRFLDPIFFEDFTIGGDFYQSLEEVL